jgi:hypothetical protein
MFCYRFDSEKQFLELAANEGLVDEEGALVTGGHGWAIDTVGTISKGGEWDAETGEVIVPPVTISGYHVNVIGFAPLAWDDFLVVVNHPVRIFAGGPTQAPDTETLEAMTAL